MAKTALNKSLEFERYYQDLGNNNDTKFFDSMKDVFMFALTLGFKHGSPLPFEKSGGEPISLRFFREDDENIFNLIALSVTNDISILLEDDESKDAKYRIIEEYANGGMNIMVNAFCKPIVDFEAFKRFIESYDTKAGQEPIADMQELLRRAMDNI